MNSGYFVMAGILKWYFDKQYIVISEFLIKREIRLNNIIIKKIVCVTVRAFLYGTRLFLLGVE